MIVSIHQPHFLPWLGYLDRMRRCDLFVLLDHVQFERQNYQNRVRIKTGQGPQWLVVPLVRGSQSDTICEKRVDNLARGRHRWGRRVYLTLEHAYRGAPGFAALAPRLKAIFDSEWERLVDLDLALLELLRDALGIDTPLVRSSELDVTGHRSDLVLSVCRAVGASVFLGGIGQSKHYLDTEALRRAGIDVAWQSFAHPRYHQHPRARDFVEGLSAIDLLANCGLDSSSVLEGVPAVALHQD
jgi:hypothetical protein